MSQNQLRITGVESREERECGTRRKHRNTALLERRERAVSFSFFLKEGNAEGEVGAELGREEEEESIEKGVNKPSY